MTTSWKKIAVLFIVSVIALTAIIIVSRLPQVIELINPKEDLVDTDKDGLPDVYEIDNGLDFEKPDTDGDGILDGDEVQQNLNPLQPENELELWLHSNPIVKQTI